jgi:hypothetical protein
MTCWLPLLLILLLLVLLLLIEVGGSSVGMRVSGCWSAWLRAAMYFIASLSVVILVSFSLPLSC